jgi:hypothetical protein
MAKESRSAKKNERELGKVKEPTILVRPISRFGGLDNIHVALIALVIILIALLLLITYTKPFVITNSTANSTSCTNCSAASTHNASQIKAIAEMILATYANANNSLSVLPFYTNVSRASVSYIPAARSWYVSMPSIDPLNNQTFYISTIISDTNTDNYTPFYQLPKPQKLSYNKVVSPGVIQVAGKTVCLSQSPTQLYWFVDPYAPGAVASLTKMFTLQNAYNNKLNQSVKVVFGSYTNQISNQVGLGDAEALGEYLFCASKQSNYQKFVYALNSTFDGDYVSPNTLAFIANGTGISAAEMNTCLNGAAQAIEGQAVFANYYNITYTPAVITNCEYLSIPQTVNQAICDANSTLC